MLFSTHSDSYSNSDIGGGACFLLNVNFGQCIQFNSRVFVLCWK